MANKSGRVQISAPPGSDHQRSVLPASRVHNDWTWDPVVVFQLSSPGCWKILMAFQFGHFDGQSCSEAKLIALLRTRIFFGKQQAGFPTTRQGSNDATSIIDDVNHQISQADDIPRWA